MIPEKNKTFNVVRAKPKSWKRIDSPWKVGVFIKNLNKEKMISSGGGGYF